MQTFNLFDGETDTPPDGTEPPGYLCHAVRLGPKLGASLLGMSIYDLPPGEAICPYHFEWTDEEWLIVIAGAPTVRTPDGETSSARGTCSRWARCSPSPAGITPPPTWLSSIASPSRADGCGSAAAGARRVSW